MSSIPGDQKLYEKAKNKYDKMKHSAYKSGLVVKEYKRLYKEKYQNLKGVYKGTEQKKEGLNRWFDEKWRNSKGNVGYEGKKNEVYRPTKRITSKTPTTYNELSKKQIADAKKEKAKYGKVKKFDKK